MSDHNYVPSSKLGKWFNDRLPLLSLSAHLSRVSNTKKLELLVDLWWNTNFLFSYSNYYRHCIGNALCGPSRPSV